jgi:hypothetical protein
MKKDKLEQIRDRLKLDALDETKKKEMFNRFVKAGGKVVDLDKGDKKHRLTFQRNLSQRAVSPINEDIRKKRQEEGRLKAMDLSPAGQKNNPVNLWISRFSAKLGCVLTGILNWNAENFKNSFKDLILTHYQNVLLNTKMILAPLLYQDKLLQSEIKNRFSVDIVFPYYFELIYRLDSLYNHDLFDQLSLIRQAYNPVGEAKQYFIQLFKSLYILQPYYFSLKAALEKAMLWEKELKSLDSTMVYRNKKKILSYVDFIFLKIYPRLFALIDYYYKSGAIFRKLDFKDYVDFQEEDAVGYYTGKWKEDLAISVSSAAGAKKAKTAIISDDDEKNESAPMEISLEENNPIKKGLELILGSLRFSQILQGYFDQKDPRAFFSIKDKVFLTYSMVDFFDKEFSFIITSNKVAFNILFSEGKRIDIKKDLSMNYYKLSGVFERINEYLKVLKEIKKLEGDAYISIQERSVRSNQQGLQRSQVSRILRRYVKEFMEEFSKIFFITVSDYEENKKILQNPEGILGFDKKVDGERFANEKKVIEIVRDAYYLCSAVHFLLSEGDLSGFSLLVDKPTYLNLE